MAGGNAAAPANGLVQWLSVRWPAVFALGTALLMLLIDVERATEFPPALELTGAQATRVISSPWFLGTALPVLVGMIWLEGFVARAALIPHEHLSMVWWLVNAFWFHIGCDVLSGLVQVQPALTQLYAAMTPAHKLPAWTGERIYLDCIYAMELLVEAPCCLWAFWLFYRRDPARFIVETMVAGIQLAGTVAYYIPVVGTGEPAACWLSYVDRLCGSVWIVFPAVLIWRNISLVQKTGAGKRR